MEKQYDLAKSRKTLLKGTNLETDVTHALTNIIEMNYSRFGKKYISSSIANVIYSSNFLNGVIKDELHRRVANEYKKNSHQEIF